MRVSPGALREWDADPATTFGIKEHHSKDTLNGNVKWGNQNMVREENE